MGVTKCVPIQFVLPQSQEVGKAGITIPTLQMGKVRSRGIQGSVLVHTAGSRKAWTHCFCLLGC